MNASPRQVRSLAPGPAAVRIVELYRFGIENESELARISGSPRSYVTEVLSWPSRLFPVKNAQHG